MISAFSYRAGILCVEQVPLDKIAADVGTPCYIYSAERLRENYKSFADPFAELKIGIYYANKANPNQAVTKILADCGAGADVTSIGELERALHAGIPAHKIIFSGVGKRRDEILGALQAGVHQINAESMPELELINQVASELKKRAPVAIRVNPDVDAKTHRKISTGETGTKFGVDFVQLREVMELIPKLKNVELKGFQVHIGAQIYDYEPFRKAYKKMASFIQSLKEKNIHISCLDLGGGVGIPYDNQTLAPFSDYADIVKETVGDLGCELAFEPGRRLVGDAGLLLSRVVYDKHGASKRFLILDAGMNDLIRPAMYEARHSIVPVREPKSEESEPADVVGPVCETSDLFGTDYELPGVGQGDLIAILQAGAYGSAMASAYNGRAIIPEVLVSGSQYAIVRRRIAVAEQISWESLPPWMVLAKAG